MSPQDAHKWLMTGDDIEVFHNPFEDPPEAEAGGTIYLRVSAVLKRNVEGAAGKAGMSVSAWVTQCVEGCLSQPA
jgi:predicted HicB family RNase H-like nuclease